MRLAVESSFTLSTFPGFDLLFGVDRLAVESGLRQAEGLLQRSLGQRPRAPAIIRYWPKAKRTGNSITVNPIRIVDQFRQTLVSMAFGQIVSFYSILGRCPRLR